jgi:NTP pyrophosphatase (non-canonical NTP hydrolase)
MKNNIKELVELCHGAAVAGGWWTDLETGERKERNKGELLCLIHSEISEAMEGVRKGLMDDKLPQYNNETVELADALIRVFDYAGAYCPDLAEAFVAKINFNKQRADHKLENRVKEGGKKF